MSGRGRGWSDLRVLSHFQQQLFAAGLATLSMLVMIKVTFKTVLMEKADLPKSLQDIDKNPPGSLFVLFCFCGGPVSIYIPFYLDE